MNDIIGQLQRMGSSIKSYQRYILVIEYSPENDFTMDELDLLSKCLKNVVAADIAKWSLYSNEKIGGLKVSLIMNR